LPPPLPVVTNGCKKSHGYTRDLLNAPWLCDIYQSCGKVALVDTYQPSVHLNCVSLFNMSKVSTLLNASTKLPTLSVGIAILSTVIAAQRAFRHSAKTFQDGRQKQYGGRWSEATLDKGYISGSKKYVFVKTSKTVRVRQKLNQNLDWLWG
jgi:hypothetical protein